MEDMLNSKNLHSIENEKVLSQTSDAASKKKSVSLEVFIPLESDFFDGHFPSFKIFPAVAQIYLADRFAKKYLGVEGFAREIKRVKFPSPVLPETRILLALELDETCAEKKSLSFTLSDFTDKSKIYSSGTAIL